MNALSRPSPMARWGQAALRANPVPPMPELPEVETVRRGLQPAMEGARFLDVETRRGDLRTPFPAGFAKRLAGRRVVALGRRGKFLLADLDDGEVLVMHLGMSGSFRIEAGEESQTPGAYHRQRSRLSAHDHVVFTMSSGARVIYNDPRRFGLMDLLAGEAVAGSRHFKAMGVEPLGPDFTPGYLATRFGGKAAPLKAALLDQGIVAGLGNIYACEALWRSRLSPLRAAGTLATKAGKPTARATRLVDACKAVLTEAIGAGGSTLRDHALTDGTLGTFQHRFRVYDREGHPCTRDGCRGLIKRIVQNGRSTFFCSVCQR